MLIYPAIDLFQGKAVRLFKGDYEQMTVYSEHPEEIAEDFKSQGATHIHLVDLEGAKSGTTPNLNTVIKIKEQTGLFCEIGGGIRSLDVIDKYISAGMDRVIIGTAAITNPDFLKEAVKTYGDKIAVGIDIKDGYVAIHGWTVKSDMEAFDFCAQMQSLGVKTLICTDISKDGAMQGTNHQLYKDLSQRFDMQIIASGGVSSIDDVVKLSEKNLYGAIIGKAYYTGAISIKDAIEVSR